MSHNTGPWSSRAPIGTDVRSSSSPIVIPLTQPPRTPMITVCPGWSREGHEGTEIDRCDLGAVSPGGPRRRKGCRGRATGERSS